MRGSDPDAAVYYLAAMLEGGEDARFIARRMIVLASEDIGNADPRALLVAVAAAQAVEHVGLPEARLNLAQAAIYLARAPKSNASLRRAQGGDRRRARARATRPPDALRDAHYRGAKKLGRGEGYVYPHDDPRGFEVDYLPEPAEGQDVLPALADPARRPRTDGALRSCSGVENRGRAVSQLPPGSHSWPDRRLAPALRSAAGSPTATRRIDYGANGSLRQLFFRPSCGGLRTTARRRGRARRAGRPGMS